jgi:hypothetical protein
MKGRNWIMLLGLLLTVSVAQATVYTPPNDYPDNWPASTSATDNPRTEGNGGIWTAYSQAFDQGQTGTYDLGTAGTSFSQVSWKDPGGDTGVYSDDDGNVRILLSGNTDSDGGGWGVLALQPAAGGSTVTVSGKVSMLNLYGGSPSVTVEVYKLNAAGDTADLLGGTTGMIKASAPWEFSFNTSMLATDTIRIRMADLGGNRYSGCRMYLENYQIDVVPEPATMSLLAVGCLCLVRRRTVQ